MEGSIPIIIVIAVIVIVVLGVVVWAMKRKQQTEQLREKFGPEYDYTVSKAGDEREAEEELIEREKRVDSLEIRDLSPQERARFTREWEATQAEFVDSPAVAVEKADRLIQVVMKERGFPVADFEQRTADISVLYPSVVSNYREGHKIAQKSGRNGVSTEDLRQAMVYYRSLFEELLHEAEKKESTK
jgi:hypothetical protein